MPGTALDGRSLTADQVTALARREALPAVDADARRALDENRKLAAEATAHRPVYGHSTGVGANRTATVSAESAELFGMRLLRSHSGGIGPVVPDEEARAMLAVRLNQLLAGGCAVQVGVVDRLAEALAGGHLPTVHALGAIGTGDLSALAELGLTLAGERPWHGGTGEPPEPLRLTRWDALPLISSSALTIGQTALAATDLGLLLDRLPLVAALTLTAVRGSGQPYAAYVHERRPHAGAAAFSAWMRELLADADWQPALVQDPFGFRCLPQVHGAALDARASLDEVLAVELNAAAENPLLEAAAATYHHHGGFHLARLGLALDQYRLGLLGTAELSTSRLGVLVEPAFTGQPPFLATAADGSSGVMIVEYAAQSALAELRGAAQPVTLGHAVISRGVEEHASFASTGARRLRESVDHFRLVLACELVAAVRALRMRGLRPPGGGELAAFYDRAAERLPSSVEDRNLTGDVEAAAALLSAPAPA
ncbi:aromatic amino acid ammonia-lyase [Phaeacidiphilus oryzae]|uniref:aromatic amino acid ammonia-lyase n=1 Tax=Phaeacidiphilus oryzae TaxID=348818 RepID=UPI00055BB4F2|nr:aromatic amino acid ammonia-lyase [Phaeacidiphilus oryzae]